MEAEDSTSVAVAASATQVGCRLCAHAGHDPTGMPPTLENLIVGYGRSEDRGDAPCRLLP